jgi:hypothetical protein
MSTPKKSAKQEQVIAQSKAVLRKFVAKFNAKKRAVKK